MTNIDNNFFELGLNKNLLSSLNKINYIHPSPIQEKCIPMLLKGYDVLGLAKTGSGKTAAFSLPLLHNMNTNLKFTQILILVPTRELAIQVSKAIIEFSKFFKNINIAALYGGQKYDSQFRILRKGAQVVIGTPGRLLDHLKRGTLNLSKLNALVIDEADEMLKMGFIEDVESIITNIPNNHQTALFSATMPEKIKQITKKFMNNPKEVKIDYGLSKLPNIKQNYCLVYSNKSDVLIRFLEIKNFDAALIFVSTKTSTVEVSRILEKYGFNSSPLNGDMNQNTRELTLEKLKNGSIDILIATDIAARGLDISRISLVINYDVPKNYESYIHRIGRTGRAGRIGNALMLVSKYERRLLKNIEHNINLNISEIQHPSVEQITEQRLNDFISKIIMLQTKQKDLEKYRLILSKIYSSTKLDMETISLSLLKLAQISKPLVLDKSSFLMNSTFDKKRSHSKRNKFKKVMNCYKISIGSKDGLKKYDIFNVITNEFSSKNNLGNIKIFNKYSTLEISENINDEKIMKIFHNKKILNKKIKIELLKSKINKNNFRKKFNINKKKNFNTAKKRKKIFS